MGFVYACFQGLTSSAAWKIPEKCIKSGWVSLIAQLVGGGPLIQGNVNVEPAPKKKIKYQKRVKSACFGVSPSPGMQLVLRELILASEYNA